MLYNICVAGDDLVQIGIEKGESVAIWGADAATPPTLTVQPKDGCEQQRNYWGGGVVPESETRKTPAPSPAQGNRTVLRPCVFGTDGALVRSLGNTYMATTVYNDTVIQ